MLCARVTFTGFTLMEVNKVRRALNKKYIQLELAFCNRWSSYTSLSDFVWYSHALGSCYFHGQDTVEFHQQPKLANLFYTEALVTSLMLHKHCYYKSQTNPILLFHYQVIEARIYWMVVHLSTTRMIVDS